MSDDSKMEIKTTIKPFEISSIHVELSKEKKTNETYCQTLDKLFSVVFNVVKNGLGACALFLGGGFASGGVVTGSILLVIVGIFCAMTFYYIAICCENTNTSSYKEIFEIAVGKKYGIILSLMMFIMTFLIVLIYLVTITMFANDFFKEYVFDLSKTESPFIQEMTVFFIIGICVAVPCSFFTNINTYRYGSFIGFVAYIYVSILLIVMACMGLKTHHEELSYVPTGEGIDLMIGFGFIAVMGQAYTCHYNTPNFFKQCDKKIDVMKNVTIISFIFLFVINFIMGFVAYYNFGSILFTQGPPCVFLFPDELKIPKYIGMLLISLNMAFGVGITLFPNRIAINEIYQKYILDDDDLPGDEMPYTRHIFITLSLIVLLLMSAILCVYSKGFNILVTLVGIACTIFGPFIAFIFPSICYLEICYPDTKSKILAYCIITLGAISFLSGVMELIGKNI